MIRRLAFWAAALFALAGITGDLGCTSGSPTEVIEDPYLPQTSPENVLENLILSYERREIEEYAQLLCSDFLFVFQPGDKPLGVNEGWNRSQDSTGTGALFASNEVSTIRVDLTYGPAALSTEPAMPSGTMKIRVHPTILEVDQLDRAVTLRVDGDIQDMFFLPGDPVKGEDPDLWYLLEWRDIPAALAAAPMAAVETTTWGTIKASFEKPVSGSMTEPTSWGTIKSIYR